MTLTEFFKSNIKIKIMVPLVLVLIFSTSITLYINYTKIKETSLESEAQNGTGLSEMISTNIYRQFDIEKDARLLQSFLSGIKKKFPNMLQIDLISVDKIIIASTDEDSLDSKTKDVIISDLIATNKAAVAWTEEPYYVLTTMTPISPKKGQDIVPLGLLKIKFDLKNLNVLLNDLLFSNTILYLLTLATLSAFILVILNKIIINPISSYKKVLGEISKGDYSIRLDEKRTDEIGLIGQSIDEMVMGLAEKEKLKSTFNKFVSKEVADLMMNTDSDRLGGDKRIATVMFLDIRGFTTLSEKLSGESVVRMLNEIFSIVSNEVTANGGIIDKYIGDAVLSVFGIPFSQGLKTDAMNAVKAANAIKLSMFDYNKKREAKNQPIIKFGIGINSGELIAGKIGSIERMEYTVIGDTVNMAARIEKENKKYYTTILLSGDTHSLIHKELPMKRVDAVKLTGREKETVLFTPA
jgi:class 3 adenylate cyclase